MQSNPQQKSYKWDIEYNPHKYMSNNPGDVQASASHWKEKKKRRRQWKPLPTLIKEKEPL